MLGSLKFNDVGEREWDPCCLLQLGKRQPADPLVGSVAAPFAGWEAKIRKWSFLDALGWRRQKVLLGSDKSRGGTTSVTQMMIGSYQLLPKTKWAALRASGWLLGPLWLRQRWVRVLFCWGFSLQLRKYPFLSLHTVTLFSLEKNA